ncbi:MAG: hypothetical protein M1820_007965 [Bogoriella megaspora]|nr:MAG: hypothetical protein M1820_007965 [Bogoriella megaspora]
MDMLYTFATSIVRDSVTRGRPDPFGKKQNAPPLIHTSAALPWKEGQTQPQTILEGLRKIKEIAMDKYPFGYGFPPSDNDFAWADWVNGALLQDAEVDTLDHFWNNPDGFQDNMQEPRTDLFGDYEWDNDLSPTNLHPPDARLHSNIALDTVTLPVPAADVLQPTLNAANATTQPHQQIRQDPELNAALTLYEQAHSTAAQPFIEGTISANSQPTSFAQNHHARQSISGPFPEQLAFGSAGLPTSLATQTNGQTPARPNAFRFGSDASFNHSQGFLPPPNTDSHVEVQQRLVDDMNAMGHRESAPSTRAASPVLQRKRERFPDPRESDIESQGEASGEDEDAELRATKRRRSTRLEIPSPPQLKTMPRRKSFAQPKRRDRNSTNGDTGKGHKQQKENLTEEQKRSNHIMSEQKRRNIIKEGYEGLHLLVPNLKDGGFSKSQALAEAAAFLDSLVEGNKRLRDMVLSADSS